MTKKHFIALADALKSTMPTTPPEHVKRNEAAQYIHGQWIMDRDAIADVCAASNPRFNRERWLGYIAGTNGKNGGKVRP